MRREAADPAGRRRVLRAGAVAVVLLLLVGGAVGLVRRASRDATELTTQQRQLIDELESVLLHNTDSPQYDRVEDPQDGRGLVAGIGDFSTAGGGVLDVVEEYGRRAPNNELTGHYVSLLRTLAAGADPATIDLTGFAPAWQAAADISEFRQAQDTVMRRRYFDPAVLLAHQLGISSALGVAILYDTVIEHGTGDDPDGTATLIGRTNTRTGSTSARDPRGWLQTFLVVRAGVLASPAVPQHLVTWPATVERTRVLATLIRTGADDLTAPLSITAYGQPRVLDGHGPDRGVPRIAAGPPSLDRPTSTPPTAAPTTPPVPSPTTTPAATTRPPSTAPVVPPPPPPPVTLHFANFGGSAGLRLNGTAGIANGQLTLAATPQQAGSAWATTTIDPSKSFTTSFTVSIANITDGVAFVVQSQAATALGTDGGGLGYGGLPGASTPRIAPSLDVELDPWDNSGDGFDPAGHQHIAVMNNGDITQHLFWADPGFSLYGAAVHVWLTYNAGQHSLAVYASQSTTRPAGPLFTAAVNLTAVVGTGRAYVGFTGGCGQIAASEAILNWDFAAS